MNQQNSYLLGLGGGWFVWFIFFNNSEVKRNDPNTAEETTFPQMLKHEIEQREALLANYCRTEEDSGKPL